MLPAFPKGVLLFFFLFFLFHFIYKIILCLFLNTLTIQLMKEDEDQSVQRQVNMGHKELHIKCE